MNDYPHSANGASLPHLPRIDLHRHLDGSIRLQTILELGEAHGLPLPANTLEGLRPHVQVVEPEPSLVAFLSKFTWMVGVLADLDACRRVSREVVEDAVAEGLDYVELRFSPLFMAKPHGLDPREVTSAVLDGVGDGVKATGLPVGMIGILSRTYGPVEAFVELDALLSERDRLVAMDLAGDEAGFPGGLFVDHFKRARDAGLAITIHAGEAAGPESVWQAIRELGATRIGHGIRSIEDAELVEFLAQERIGLECSLTSNVQTSSVQSLASHPAKVLLDRGVAVTLNTDDPGISAIDLAYELQVAAPQAGFGPEDLRQVAANALEIAYLPDEAKRPLAARGRPGRRQVAAGSGNGWRS